MMDLFGNERPERKGSGAPVLTLSLFDAAAEWQALESGRPVSQERNEVMHGRLCSCGTRYTSPGLVCRACAVRMERGRKC